MTTIYTCDECDWAGTQFDMNPIDDVHQRVEPGELMPAGQCPRCGALLGVDDADVPDYTLNTCAGIAAERAERSKPPL